MINIEIDNKIRLNKTLIQDDVYRFIREQFMHKNPEYYKKRNSGFTTRGVPQTIATYETKKNIMSMTRGGIRRLKTVFKDNDYKINIVDKRISKPFPYPIHFEMKDINTGELIMADKFQKKQIRNAIVKEQGILVTPTSGGKTIIMSLIINEIQECTLIVMHTSKLMNQWIKFLAEAFNLPETEIGIVGGGKFIIKPITVGLVQTVSKKYKQLSEHFGCIMMDECHHAPAPSFMNSIDPFPARYRYGCTATDYRKDGKQFLMFDVFGDVVFRITDENLKEIDRICDVSIKVIKTNFEYREYDEDEDEIEVHPSLFLKKLTQNKERNALIYKVLEPELAEHYNIILTDRLVQAKGFKIWLSKKGIDAKLFIGGKKYQQEGNEAIEQIDSGKLHCILGINQASSEGISIHRLDRGYIVTPSAGNKGKLIQQHGRLKRKHPQKTNAILYYFWDYKMFPEHIKLIYKYFGKENIEIIDTYCE